MAKPDFFKVTTGKHSIEVRAADHEHAAIEALRTILLEGAGQFIAIRKEGEDENQEQWGLTEWYLDRAGYESIGENKWKKINTPVSPVTSFSVPEELSPDSSSSSSPRRSRVKSSPTRPHSDNIRQVASSSLTVSSVPSKSATPAPKSGLQKKHSTAQAPTPKQISSNSKFKASRQNGDKGDERLMRSARRVKLERSPEEWAALLDQTRRTKDAQEFVIRALIDVTSAH
jgi:hypothetical protein